MPCKHNISLLVVCVHCKREEEDATKLRLVRLYCDHHGVRPPPSFIEALLDDQHDTKRNTPMPQPEDQTTETVEDIAIGVRIVRRLENYSVVTIQILDAQRGWLDFYQMKWVDLAHGRLTPTNGHTAPTIAMRPDDLARMMRAVAMAAAKYERESIRDLYASVH